MGRFTPMKYVYNTLCFCLVLACQNRAVSDKQADSLQHTPQVSALQKALQQYPDSLGLHWQLATVADSIGNYTLATAAIDSMIQKDSMNYALWFKKGQIMEHAADTIKAIGYYNIAAKIYASPDVLLALANLYAETKNPLALTMCQLINRLRMGKEYDSYTAFFTAIYHERCQNYPLAISWLNQSIANNYTFMDAYMEKGFIYYDTKQYSEALKTFQLAATINNTYADAPYWQAKCLEAMNQKAAAVQKYQIALSLNKHLTEASQALQRLQ